MHQKKLKSIFIIIKLQFVLWFLTIYSDCRNLNKREIYNLRFDIEKAATETITNLSLLAHSLMQDFNAHARLLEMKYQHLGKMTIQCFYPKHSKPIIDEIDRVLAKHYGFTD